MKKTITLKDVEFDGSWCIRFNDKNFGTPSPEELESYSYDVLQNISNQLLRSLLFIEYMKNNNLNISATIDTDDPSGIWVKLDG